MASLPPPTEIIRRHSLRRGDAITLMSLQNQAQLLPQALGVFAILLPIYVWVGSFAPDSAFLAASLAVFAIDWAAFYVVVNWIKSPQAGDPSRRLRVHILGGLLWAAAIAQIAAFGDGAGPDRVPILLLAAGAAMACLFFLAASLPALLIVGPAAAALPLLALLARPSSRELGVMAGGGFAVGLMLMLILNRSLRAQFALLLDREALAAERAQSLQRAESLARSKSSLAATLSQEIRSGLSGLIHILAAQTGPRGTPSRSQIAAAISAAGELVGVLNATLDSERAEAGELEVSIAPFDAVAKVLELADEHRAKAAEEGLEFALWIDPELDEESAGAALADPERSRQIVSSLLSNAVKYTQRGRIEARVERRGEKVAIAVADTGPGLSESELALAFEPFGRIERTGAGVAGAGLGLPLSRRLAELMGGELLAKSAQGVGSCFTLVLPYDPDSPRPAARESDEARPRGALKVLLSDDDPLSAAMLRKCLEELGHQVAQCRGRERLIDLARGLPFDLVVLRLAEDEDPHQQIALLRRSGERLAAIPLVLAAGGPEAARARGAADAVLRLPASLPSLARAVAEALAAPAERVAFDEGDSSAA